MIAGDAHERLDTMATELAAAPYEKFDERVTAFGGNLGAAEDYLGKLVGILSELQREMPDFAAPAIQVQMSAEAATFQWEHVKDDNHADVDLALVTMGNEAQKTNGQIQGLEEGITDAMGQISNGWESVRRAVRVLAKMREHATISQSARDNASTAVENYKKNI